MNFSRFQGEHIKPLCHLLQLKERIELSYQYYKYWVIAFIRFKLKKQTGFEPVVSISYAILEKCHLKPLGHYFL